MRQYQYQATDETVEALRQLRGAWAAYRVERGAFTVWLADGREVRMTVDVAAVEAGFEAARLSAAVASGLLAAVPPVALGAARSAAAAVREAPDFAVGRNDVVLLSGATWIEGPPGDGFEGGGLAGGAPAPAARAPRSRDNVVQFSGGVAQLSETAAAVCLTTDAIVVATPVGTGFLVRTGVQPRTVDVTDDAGEIARFLRARGYT